MRKKKFSIRQRTTKKSTCPEYTLKESSESLEPPTIGTGYIDHRTLAVSILMSLAVIANYVPHSNVLLEFIYRICQALTCRKTLPSWSPWGARLAIYLLIAFLGHTLNRCALGITPSWMIADEIPLIWYIVLLAYAVVHFHKSLYYQLATHSSLQSALKLVEMVYKFRGNSNLIALCILQGYRDHWIFIGGCCSIDICTSGFVLKLLTSSDMSWSERCTSLTQDLVQSILPGSICVLTFVMLPHYRPDLKVLGMGLALVYFGYRYCATHYRGIVTQLRSCKLSTKTKKSI